MDKERETDEKRNMIYLAALLHDIGKFYERAFPDKYDNDNVYKWSHAVYTRAFYDDYEAVKDILKKFDHGDEARDINLINLAAKHHQPGNTNEKIIQYADWFSSSERLPKADEDYQEGKSRQPILSVFSNIFSEDDSYKKFLPLQQTSIENIPVLSNTSKDVGEYDYKKLWEEFLEEFSELNFISNIKIFAETFYELLEKYTTFIPSSTRKNEIPDVSLFDHSKTTAAFAVSIFNYLKDTGKDVDTVQVKDKKPFILIGADLSGIQDFIYDIIGKNASKNLKGRSFFIQILMESIVRLILRELGLYKANVIYSAGGNFYIIAQNTIETISKLNRLITKINKALADAYRRKLYLALDYTEFGKNDLIDEGRLGEIWEELISIKIGKKKKQRYLNDLDKNFFKPTDLAEEAATFNGELIKDIITGEIIFKGEKTEKIDGKKVRLSTLKQIMLGRRLRDANYWIISFEKHPNIKEDYIFNPFDKAFMSDDDNGIEIYNYFLKDSPDYFNNSEIIRLNELDFYSGIHKDNIQGFDYYGGNDFPVYEKDERKVKEGEAKEGEIKQFDDLAEGDNLDRLGVLRMDVDNLGKIFALGLKPEMRTFSRFTTLSRSLDWFFRGYLNTIWKEFKDDTMIIYSGGDDLFIVGRWDKTIQFAQRIKEDFKRWTCGNPGITLSGGVVLVTGKFPILKAAAMAGDYESMAKNHTISKKDCNNISKNAFTLFGEPLNWDMEFPIVQEIKEKILSLSKGGAPKSLARILMQFHLIREKQREHNERFNEGKENNRVNESWYWMILYYLKRFAERHKNDDQLFKYVKLVMEDILANTYDKKTLFLLNKSNHILNYYALAARWVELEMRTEN